MNDILRRFVSALTIEERTELQAILVGDEGRRMLDAEWLRPTNDEGVLFRDAKDVLEKAFGPSYERTAY